MPSDADVRSPQQKTGLIALILGAILVIAGAVLLTAYSLGFVTHGVTVTCYFANAEGLKQGAAVDVNGVTVGTVQNVTITAAPERRRTPVLVTMQLKNKDQDSVRSDSLADLVTMGALADTIVDIDSEHATGPPIEEGAELKTLRGGATFDMNSGQSLVKALGETEDRFNGIVTQMESGKGSLGQFISDPGFVNDLSVTVTQFRDATAKLGSNNNTVGKLLNDHSLSGRFAAISNDMQGVGGSVNKLTNGPLQANLATTQTRVDSITAGINSGQGAAGMLVKNPKQFTDTFAQANALVTGYWQNPATGGNFASGGATAVDMAKLQSEINTVMADIRKNPKRYFTTQFRVF
jgi:phospholipid/cholesterol/gamma-HCH transport system substrate-binding protein